MTVIPVAAERPALRQAIFSDRNLYQICPQDLAVHIHIHLKPIGSPILQPPVQCDGAGILNRRPLSPGCPAFTAVLRAVDLSCPSPRHGAVQFKNIPLSMDVMISAPQVGQSLLHHRQGNLRLRAGERHSFKGRPRRYSNLINARLCDILPAASPIHRQIGKLHRNILRVLR